MTVIREDRVITIAEQGGMRGRDGGTSLLVSAVAENAGSYWSVSPDAPIVDLGAKQIFFARAPAAHTGSSLFLLIEEISGLEQRPVRLADGTTAVPITAVPEGASFAFHYDSVGGFYRLIWPSVSDGGGALVPCDVVNSSTFWTMTPDEEVVAFGADQVFFGIAPATHSGSALYVEISVLTGGEERPVRLADGTTPVAPSDVPPGSSFAVRYNTVSGVYQLIWPALSVASASSIVMMEQTSRTNNIVLFEAKEGFELPNTTGYGVIMGAQLSGSPVGGWAFGVDGITLDPLVLRYPDDTAVESNRIADGAFILWTRNAVTDRYNLLEVWDADSVKPATESGGDTAYEARRAFYTSRNIQIAAAG